VSTPVMRETLTWWFLFIQWSKTQRICIFYKQSHRWKLLQGNCRVGRKREWEREERVWETVCCCKRVLASVINLIVGQISRILEIDNPPEQGLKKTRWQLRLFVNVDGFVLMALRLFIHPVTCRCTTICLCYCPQLVCIEGNSWGQSRKPILA
jgi:hypothetical protein